MLHYASCCDLGIRQLVPMPGPNWWWRCWHTAMWPPDAAGPWSPVVRVISLRSVAWHNTQHNLPGPAPVQSSGYLYTENGASTAWSRSQQSASGWEIVNVALRGEEWCSPSLTTAQFKYVCGWWCMTKLPPARPSPVTGTKGCLHSRVCPQFYTTSQHWTRHSIQ